jgi:aminopeptidase N
LTQRCVADDKQDEKQGGQTHITLRQTRFSSQVEPLPGGPWQIPLRLSRGSQTQTLVMKGQEQTVTLPGCEPLPWLANAGGRGYYRVEYEPAARARIAAGFTTLAPADRVALLSDSYALASAGRRPMAEHLALLGAVAQVKDDSRAALFALALAHWRNLDTALDGTPAQMPLRAAAIALFGPELERLGWQVTPGAPGEDSESQTLRSDLIYRLAHFGHAPTLAKAHALFAATQAGGASAPPSVRAALLYAVGRDASQSEFEALMQALRATDSQEERWNLLWALAAGTNPVRAQRLLDESLSGRLPNDISSSLPRAVGREPTMSPMAYEFVVAHWAELSRLAGDGSFGGRYRLLPSAAESSSDPAVARRMVADQERLAGAAGNSAAARTAATIENRSRLRQREAPALAASLGR